jgi:hypothetical protein
MNPLVVAGGICKQVDTRLLYLQPIGMAQVLACGGEQF